MSSTFDLAGQLGLSGLKDQKIRIVAVGDAEQWQRQGNPLPRGSDMCFVSFRQVDAELLERCEPEFILSPVVSHDFDCIDLAAVLHGLGYRKPYRAISADLPSPSIIEREIRQLWPTIDFAVIIPL